MENNNDNNVTNKLQSGLPSVVKTFNHKRNAVFLMIAGIVGIILSVKYYLVSNYIFNNPCNWDFGGNCVNNGLDLTELKTAIIQALYYGIVALIILISSALLFFKKRLGTYLYIAGFCLILLSLFIPSEVLSFPDKITFFFDSLFLRSIFSAGMSGFYTEIGSSALIIAGVLVYFFFIIRNLVIIKKWKKFLAIKIDTSSVVR